jgi:uncharacterized delta-60 repeat protein
VATYPQIGTPNDGKIVAAGFTTVVTGGRHGSGQFGTHESVVARYNLDGTPDTSFGTGGQVIDTMSVARAVAVQNDGKILVAGGLIARDGVAIPLGSNSLALARYNPNGSVDTSFGKGGMVLVAFATGSDTFGEAVSVQPDGKIVVAGGNTVYGGTKKTPTATGAIVLARFNVGGSLDISFGKSGTVLSTVPTNAGGGGEGWFGMGMALDPATGRIAVEAPDQNGKGMVVCYTGSGQLDATFAGTGFHSMPDLFSGPAITILPSGHQIVVAGQSIGATETLVSFNPDGAPNPLFGANGTVSTNLRTSEVPQTLILQPDGHILLGMSGDGGDNEGQVMEVVRFDRAGTLDTAFGHGGIGHTPVRPTGDGNEFEAMAVGPDGRIVIVGDDMVVQPQLQFDLARFLATGPQISSLIVTPPATGSSGPLTLTASAITDGNPGAKVVQVAFYYLDNTGTVVSLGNGSPDGFGGWTIPVNVPSGTTLFAQALDSLGALGDPVSISL